MCVIKIIAMNFQNKRLRVILLLVAAILMIPFIAMQFTDEVNWKLFDFILMGSLLFLVGLVLDLVMRKVKKLPYRVAISVIIVLTFILIWAELAVGIFGSPFAGS
jgi:peptidoglycan/LPS O-acetylase OafA/YrhL